MPRRHLVHSLLLLPVCLPAASSLSWAQETLFVDSSSRELVSEYRLVPWWPDTNFEETIYTSDTEEVDLDLLATPTVLEYSAPVALTARYYRSDVQPGALFPIDLQLSTYDAGTEPHGVEAGVEMAAELRERYRLGSWEGEDVYSPWVAVSAGLDLGIDIHGEGRPPMAGESIEAWDTIDTPLCLPPKIAAVACINLTIRDVMRNGRVTTTMTVQGGTLWDSAGLAPDSDGRVDLLWNTATTWRRIWVEVPTAPQPGDSIVLDLTSLMYTFTPNIRFGANLWVAGYETEPYEFYSITTIDEDVGDDDVLIDIPINVPDPDLAAGSFWLSRVATHVEPDRSLDITARFFNNSSTDIAAAFDASLGVRSLGAAPFLLVNDASRPSLGRYASDRLELEVPANTLAPGDYEAVLELDTGGAIAEGVETNNTRSIPFTVVELAPDLRIDSPSISSAPSMPTVDDAITLSAVVHARDRASFTTPSFDVVASRRDAEGVWQSLAVLTLPGLDPGEQRPFDIEIPAESMPAGTWIVRLTADAPNNVDETNEGNNSGFSAVTVGPRGVDLFSTPLDMSFHYGDDTGSVPPLPGENVVVWLSVHNGGGRYAESTDVVFERVVESGVEPLCDDCVAPTQTIDSGQSGFVAVQFEPDADGPWVIRATIMDPEGTPDSDLDNNSVTRELYVGTPAGDLGGRVEDESGTLVAGAVVSIAELGHTTISSQDPLPDGLFPFSNYRLDTVPSGFQTVTVTADGYHSAQADVEVLNGHPLRLDFRLEALSEPDLSSGIIVTPSPAPPATPFDLSILLRNQGDRPFLPGQPIVIRFSIGGDPFPDVEYDAGLQPGEEVEMPMPGGPFFTMPLRDTIVEVVLDPDDALPEANEWNNGSLEIVTNAKPEVAVQDVQPEPAPWGSPVTLSASASDPDGYVLESRWFSDIDGLLGVGTVVTTDRLSVGSHHLTFEAVDERGERSRAEHPGFLVQDVIGPLPNIVYGPGRELVAPASPSFIWNAVDDVTPQAGLEYSVRLDGANEDWSAWSGRRDTYYTSLPAGQYSFQLRARDAAGNLSAEPASIGFTVSDPLPGPLPEDPCIDDPELPECDESDCGCTTSAPRGPWAYLLCGLLFMLVAFRRAG